jgi:hypothetical protein
LLRCFFIAFSILASVSLASATTIDFEAQGASAPSTFTGHLDSPLTIGIATFLGGQLLRNESAAADSTVVYATTNQVAGPYTDPLTIAFSQPVSAFSIVVTNGLPDTYTIADNVGGSSSAFVNANTNHTFSLSDSGIASITISSLATVQWDFAIDNVTFTAATAVPEPATTVPIAGLLLSGAVIYWRRR